MPRPKTKDQLIELAGSNFDELLDLLADVPKDRRDEPGVVAKWSSKDVIAHLHEWHNMMLRWYKEGQAGKEPEIPAPGYTWKTVPELNAEIYETYKDEQYDKLLGALKRTHKKLIAIIKQHSDKELFTKKLYPWTGSTSLGSYLVSATSSHYDWGIVHLKKWLKKNE